MIARIWHGYTKPENADAYEAMLKPKPLPGQPAAYETAVIPVERRKYLEHFDARPVHCEVASIHGLPL